MNYKKCITAIIIALVVIITIFAFPKSAHEAGALANIAEDSEITPLKPSETNVISKKVVPPQNDIETLISQEFGTSSVMVKVAKCESGLRQFNPDGSVVRGIVNHQDVGVFQINEGYHLSTALKMGIDIYTINGNIKYAKYLYDKNGTADWRASEPCWNKQSVE